jgi:hypothetical protein
MLSEPQEFLSLFRRWEGGEEVMGVHARERSCTLGRPLAL